MKEGKKKDKGRKENVKRQAESKMARVRWQKKKKKRKRICLKKVSEMVLSRTV